ncbi:hypothetical protein RclHR1_04410007 [Rhizophagus clarus]|uniref:BTB/POZ domain-containing protein n=1 Tax=Rhizophagus clarus TaxID=94130 RepID=A0A2Z6RIK7_9GLOM|nr:hypothetical protein RclHR1_04410007 [Rhizophagus clarus]GES81033.1 BTB/POZ domain-containing protein [Rhizophagus clarus]
MSYKFWEIAINDYEKLLETGERSDVIIYVGENEKEFHAHSVILCVRSEYFRAAFSKNWAEKKDGKLIFKKPNIESNLFQIILRFIYCGDVDLTKLQGPEVLKLLIAVDELDIQPLIPCIQEYITKNKSDFLNQNPIEILEIVYQHEKFTELWNFCLDKICEEPEKLINSDKFISLKAPLLELLLKRDDFGLDEIIIWEGLIKWGLAQNPTISQDVKIWNKEQFTIMERTLHKFIPLVRFYHIPSDVFFYKVLPYKKLLPKQLVYEITEYNMVPDKKSIINIQSSRQSKLKFGSSIIDFRHFTVFASWIDEKNNLYYNSKNIPYHFDLLYRASRNGIDTLQFHNKCNDKGATIVIAKVKGTDRIVGGYNPLMWDSSNSTKSTTDSFIFSFTDKKDISTAIIGRVNYAKYAIYCYRDHGPAFGPGYDLYYNNLYRKWHCSQEYYYPIYLPFTEFVSDDYEVFQVIKK